jgi:hypothetical protein
LSSNILREISVASGTGISHVFQAFLQPGFVGFAHRDQIDIVEFLAVGDMLFSNQPETNKPDADAIIGADHAFVGCRRESSGPQKGPPRSRGSFAYGDLHSSSLPASASRKMRGMRSAPHPAGFNSCT